MAVNPCYVEPPFLQGKGKSDNLEKRKRVPVHEDLEGKTKQKRAQEHRILKTRLL